jgi:hypothetical protein
MRKRLVLNEDFYQHYPYRMPIDQTVNKVLYCSFDYLNDRKLKKPLYIIILFTAHHRHFKSSRFT